MNQQHGRAIHLSAKKKGGGVYLSEKPMKYVCDEVKHVGSYTIFSML